MIRFTIILLSFMVVGCDSNNRVSEAVNELSSEWEVTGEKISKLDQTFDSTINSVNKKVSQKALVDDRVKGHSEKLYLEWVNAKMNLLDVMKMVMPIQAGIADLQREFAAKSKNLNSLKSSIKEGDLGDDTSHEIEELNTFRQISEERIDQLHSGLDSSETYLNAAVERWINTYEKIREELPEPESK